MFENVERERTGIPNLKVGYNKVFGYYLDITKSYYDKIPDNYIRKQTLANSERFITPELKETEALVLNAETKINQKEYELFTDFLAQAGTDTGLFMMWERNNIIQEKLYEVIRQNAGVTDADVEEYIEETINNAKDAYENDLESYESKYTAFYAPEGTRVVEQIFFKFSDTTANEIVAYRNDGDDETADSLLAQAIENV
mgnify:CR=1 FL=1